MPGITSSDHSAIAYRNRLFEDVRTVSEWLVEQIEPQRRLANVESRVIDAQQIDLPDNSVDGVVSQFGLMIPPPGRRRLLRCHVDELTGVLRVRLEPSLAPYEHDGALELPWTAMVTGTV